MIDPFMHFICYGKRFQIVEDSAEARLLIHNEEAGHRLAAAKALGEIYRGAATDADGGLGWNSENSYSSVCSSFGIFFAMIRKR
jgi:hypothetical protein